MTDQHAPDPNRNESRVDPVYNEQPPAGTGSAGSFDSRHNEFPGGQEGAGVDPETREPAHGDGLNEQTPEEPFTAGYDAEQPGEAERRQ